MSPGEKNDRGHLIWFGTDMPGSPAPSYEGQEGDEGEGGDAGGRP